MNGPVLVVSRAQPMAALERLVRRQLKRHGGAALVTPVGDERCYRQLHRLGRRLEADQELQVRLQDGWGWRHVTVTPAGQAGGAWWNLPVA